MIKAVTLVGVAMGALGFFESVEEEVYDPQLYRCQDGHDVSVEMESQCLEMHIDQTAYVGDDFPEEWGEEDWNSTEGFLSYALNLKHSFNDTEIVGNRKKYAHAFGVTVPIAWKPTKAAKDGNYTGLFRTGGKHGFLRFSIPKVAFSTEGPSRSPPAVAVKLFRRLSPSGNLLFISSDDGAGLIPSRLSTHTAISRNGSWLTRAHRSTLESYTVFPGFSGTSRFAKFDRFGMKGDDVVFPFEVHLVASKSLRALAAPDATTPAKLLSTLRDSIPSEGKLFDVYAVAEPRTLGGASCVTLTSRLDARVISAANCSWQKIGAIYAKGAAKTSAYGDEIMHFSHTRFEEDLEYECSKTWKAFLYHHGAISKTRLLDGTIRFFLNAANLMNWLMGEARESLNAFMGTGPARIGTAGTEPEVTEPMVQPPTENGIDEHEHPHGSLEGKDIDACPYMAALKKAREAKEAEERAKVGGA
mmetsp:Transcript_12947/g.25344  ORF Transcript_12947/g.25344 Transcript_12947/m.25344 type:complete len:472 (-) Transcript_12947:335-1750(-)